ncbi:hypothetical protein [uncultured Maribacter sp.]|uniref:hypothetical protein n=1 Tax=uncultured Maribacter sp. TaxID=431308 RepID=UPI0026021946|nr:hypothetical protein [uncultured Maribacter sp.]
MKFKNIKELVGEAISEKLYINLVEQIKKDFILANIDLEISLKVEPINLIELLHEKIYVLILEKFDKYLNLLYVVDVPEKAFKEIKVTDAVDIAEQVCFLIIKRELQKVRLKEKYR